MTDLIDRQAAIDAHCELCTDKYKCNHIGTCPDVEVFRLIPSAEPKKGKWVLHDGYYCTSCGYKLLTTAIPDRCPSCMVDMRGVEE